jgi:hypothetical protein
MMPGQKYRSKSTEKKYLKKEVGDNLQQAIGQNQKIQVIFRLLVKIQASGNAGPLDGQTSI